MFPQLLPTVVSCVIPTGRRYCKNLLTPHRRSKFPEVFLKFTRLNFPARNQLAWNVSPCTREVLLQSSLKFPLKYTAEFDCISFTPEKSFQLLIFHCADFGFSASASGPVPFARKSTSPHPSPPAPFLVFLCFCVFVCSFLQAF